MNFFKKLKQKIQSIHCYHYYLFTINRAEYKLIDTFFLFRKPHHDIKIINNSRLKYNIEHPNKEPKDIFKGLGEVTIVTGSFHDKKIKEIENAIKQS